MFVYDFLVSATPLAKKSVYSKKIKNLKLVCLSTIHDSVIKPYMFRVLLQFMFICWLMLISFNLNILSVIMAFQNICDMSKRKYALETELMISTLGFSSDS